jgi:hypothetical protein
MLFSVLINIAFAFLGPLGAATVMVGDWMFNAFVVAKVVENVVPNGPAIVGNITAIFPVMAATAYSVAEPILRANYTGVIQEVAAKTEFGDWAGNLTQAVSTMFQQAGDVPEL